ncbi:UDP-N-acetylmuramoyl-tripeptide--D-alanyl-D-alanine ligase [Luteimonas abyssi]|uniref:UDP-N-acetylmuramoyl-tripeptide--D-alanyl-D- alanine ligase n=1 Tax=Luteimonas abyssi TaxID=1247514 RepID=UPI000737BF75|nr:UDP-N-acetylmuramoyl-tripeptide--D-alanyl-D-alanine ligase [Luteimonas abyssi]
MSLSIVPMPLSRIARLTQGRLHASDPDAANDPRIDAVETDTRAFVADDGRTSLFVALKGERFDGNEHIASAAEQGASAALVSRPADVAIPQIVVADTQTALAAWAGAVQRERAATVVGITGSNGKTSVKELVRAILSRLGATYANPGNRNNEIGLPLSVLGAPDDARFSIYEMGAGKPGDIAWLTAIARPQVALVNNVAPAHLERMGSLFGVAETKGAIYEALPPGGIAVINADDAFAPYFAERAHGRRLLRFGIEAAADVRAHGLHADGAGTRFTLALPDAEVQVDLPLAGRHNVSNALAAATIGWALGADAATIAAALATTAAVAGRQARHRLPGGGLLIDDSYNANPGSMVAAIDTLGAVAGRRWLVLGDMNELGADARALHTEIGRRARQAGIERLYAVGPLSVDMVDAFGEGARHHPAQAELIEALRADVRAEEAAGEGASLSLLIKGSRSSAMERVVSALLITPEDTADAA